MKICSKCKQEKPIIEFCRDKNRKSGRYPQCKSCAKEYIKIYTFNNKDKLKEYHKKLYIANKGQIDERNKLWSENNKEHKKEQSKLYRKLNRNKINNIIKIWEMNNKERIKERKQIYRNSPAKYDTYADRISWCEEVRRDPDNYDYLQIRCTQSSCRKWFTPTKMQVGSRLSSLNGGRGELRFYCSDGCKQNCPIWNKSPEQLMKEDAVKAGRLTWLELNREVQPQLRQMVFKRDGWKCTKCESTESLHCHHVEGIRWEPLQSSDIDMCITVCKECHKEIHQKDGCKYNELKCLDV